MNLSVERMSSANRAIGAQFAVVWKAAPGTGLLKTITDHFKKHCTRERRDSWCERDVEQVLLSGKSEHMTYSKLHVCTTISQQDCFTGVVTMTTKNSQWTLLPMSILLVLLDGRPDILPKYMFDCLWYVYRGSTIYVITRGDLEALLALRIYWHRYTLISQEGYHTAVPLRVTSIYSTWKGV